MISVHETPTFTKWLTKLRDVKGRFAILRRIERIKADGYFGDCEGVGDEVSELRVHIGPGYRVYFTERAGAIIVLLCGGDKDSQDRDIAAAKRMAKE